MVTGEESTRPILNVDSEIVSLFARPTCPKPPNFPIKNTLALYSTLTKERLLICGFNDQENECFRYQILENKWVMEEFALLENRSHASGVSLGDDSWIITGGQTYFEGSPVLLNTSEILNNSEFIQGPSLPIPLSGHCSLKLNDEKIFVAGGYGETYLMDSFILNIKTYFWGFLPLMKYGRFGHACGKTISLFNEIELVVAGGLHQNTIEKYSLTHSKWFTLPNINNQPIFKSASVQGETAFIITGGVELEPDCKKENCRQDVIRLYDRNLKVLVTKNKRLMEGRGNHVASSMPLDIVCSGKLSE